MVSITQSMSGEPRDLAELIENLREASERGLFDGDALVMLEGVLAVADMQVRDIMVPRSQMVFVERDESPDKLVELVVESGHSRFPVIEGDSHRVAGVVQDITEKKQLETQFFRAQRLESIGTLASGIAHDPLGVASKERGDRWRSRRSSTKC